MIHRLCPWWFLHCSRAPVARLLRAERHRLDAELALIFPEASVRIRERVLASLASQYPR
ncbi:hypothetical protein ACIBJD_01350 [Kitasatospora sp. NPDC050467]|uniref:hypothetical protein n=1 Tax=Kitasatospora sp. NPDC050467 TaxID=3364053 RepID=UPI00379C5F23